MMHKFKVGDWVRCVDAHKARTLRLHGVYIVTAITPHGNVRLEGTTQLDDTQITYHRDRFTLFEHAHSKGATTMTTAKQFKVGDKIRRVGTVSTARQGYGVRQGGIYEVLSIVNTREVKLVGVSDDLQWATCEFELCLSVDEHSRSIGVIVLAPEKVAEALFTGKPLEYFHNERWHEVQKPEAISISFMKSGCFRYKPVNIVVNGLSVPPQLEQLPKQGLVYGVSFSKREVYPCAATRATKGTAYWSSPYDAQQALLAVLKPFGMVAKDLSVSHIKTSVPTLEG